MQEIREIRHFHMFCGSGGGGKGFNSAQPRVGNMIGKFRCIGGIDVDPGAIHDFKLLTGVDGTLIDVFDRDQYIDFHGHEPSAEWKEITISDLHKAANNERPNIVFLSPPCKGFSGLLAEAKSKTDKYRALNRLTVRGVWLMLEAWKDDPPELIILENVPRIASRGQYLLDQIKSLLSQFGYAVAETSHDCGELGGLAQSRKRFLLVARHTEKVPPFIFGGADEWFAQKFGADFKSTANNAISNRKEDLATTLESVSLQGERTSVNDIAGRAKSIAESIRSKS